MYPAQKQKHHRVLTRILSLLLLLAVCLTVFPGPGTAQAADYIAACHTKSNGCPYYIMVNRTCNTVTIYTLDDSGYYTVPYKAMVCSTGRSGHQTPTGTFSITSYKTKWNYMVDGSYGQYASQFSGNYLFHSVCYSSRSNSSLLTDEYNALGNYASLGCVRLQVADAKWIYDNCAAGTKVTIYDGTDPGPLGKPEKAVAEITSDTDCGWDPTDPASGNPWNVTVTARNSSWCTGTGSVTGSGTYLKSGTVTLTAKAGDSSVFSGWYDVDGYLVSKQNPWTFTATGDVIYEALFEKKCAWKQLEDGTWQYTVNDVPQTGWQKVNGKWYYLDPETGIMQTGWQKIDGSWYYLNSSMQTGWQKIGGRWYYLNNAMRTGWQMIDGKWYYLNNAMRTGWQKISGKWYYLNSSMQTGWQKISGSWYYLNSSMQTGWQKVGGKWYYLDPVSGAMQTGWQDIDGKRYYLNSSMQTGWQQIDGRWYYLNSAAVTGWKTISGTRYYFDETGAMQTGWQTIDDETYYFDDSGAMATGWWTIDGAVYDFDDDGVLLRETGPEPG